jgi:hypothetical protein
MNSQRSPSGPPPRVRVCFICGREFPTDDPGARRFYLGEKYRDICSDQHCLMEAGYRQYLEEFDALGNMG